MIRYVPGMPTTICYSTEADSSRLGDPNVFSWSPFWTLIRLLDSTTFDDIGHEAMRQRAIFIREFNNPKSNIGKFDGIMKIARTHVENIASTESTGMTDDIRLTADHFAAGLWGEILYGRSDLHADSRVMRVADEILRRAGSPWSSALYSLMLTLKLVKPGKPIPSEAKIRDEIQDIFNDNFQHLENFEKNNPGAPLRTIRSLSVSDGGETTGPLTRFATMFSRLNVFGMLHHLFPHYNVLTVHRWSS